MGLGLVKGSSTSGITLDEGNDISQHHRDKQEPTMTTKSKNLYFPRTITCAQKKFYYDRKTQKNDVQSAAGITSSEHPSKDHFHQKNQRKKGPGSGQHS